MKLIELYEAGQILDLARSYDKIMILDEGQDGINVSDWLKANGKKIRNFVSFGEPSKEPILEGIMIKDINSMVSWNKEALLICLEKEGIDEELSKIEELLFEHVLLVKEEFLCALRQEPVYVKYNTLFEEKMNGIDAAKMEDSCQADVLFMTPPAWDIYTPFGALPCLAAALKQDGVVSEQIDVGILAFNTKLKRDWKEYAKNLQTEGFYEGTVKEYINNPYEKYEDFKDALWFFKGETFPLQEVKQRYNSLNRVQLGVLDTFYQNIANSLSVNINFDLEKSIEDVLLKYDKNLLIDSIIEMGVAGKIVHAPKIVGISITGTNQFLPGCVLAQIIKRFNPETQIIVGGSAVDVFLFSSYPNKNEIRDYFDYVITGEGETAIRKLVQSIMESKEVDYVEIPNLVRFMENGELVIPEVFLEEVDELPTPCFDGVDFSLYMAPQPMIPYQASRGCHYGYCAFCDHNSKYRHNYRTKNVTKVVEDLLHIKKQYDIKYFQFVDEAIRPDCFEEMIEEMDKYDEFKETKWIYYSRVSRQYNEELLKKAKRNGCEMVMFGVETFNQRLLNFIKKGIGADTSKYCIELFSKAGIKTFIWLMCNLPSETIQEMREDIATVKEHMGYLAGMGLGPFCLNVNTDMYRNMEAFNIVKYNPYDGTRFDSTNNGEVIDKNEVFAVYGKEYAVLPQKYFFTTNRYTIFYDGLEEN